MTRSAATAHPLRAVFGRSLLTTIGVAAALGVLAGAWYAVVASAQLALGYCFHVRVVTPAELVPSFAPTAGTGTWALYDTVRVCPAASTDVALAHRFQEWALLAPVAVFLAGCVLVLVLVARLWVGRPFTGVAAVGLGALAALVLALAVVTPWLELESVRLGVQAAGLPLAPANTSPGVTPGALEWVAPRAWSLQETDWPMMILGLVLALLAWLLHCGRRLQRDAEGLV